MEQIMIKATVNRRLLGKATRLFTGSLEGRVTEILQNARRAGATSVRITNVDGYVAVQDNGKGIENFARLLDLGGSDWAERLEASEDPAGVGLFCLAPREVTIRSNGKLTVIYETGWTGQLVYVTTDVEPIRGTRLYFQDEPWDQKVVEPLAVFTGMDVVVDGKRCPQERFIRGRSTHEQSLGARIQVVTLARMSPWHRQVARVGCFGEHNVIVNFHGQTVGFNYRPIDNHTLHYLVDLTGEPTGVRLMLPARTQLVENEAYTQLRQVLEREAFLHVQKQGKHRLPYAQYLRAGELGIELPEAEPRFQVGLLSNELGPEPVEVPMPKDQPLERCYRMGEAANDQSDQENAHLLAALGKFTLPGAGAFVPVDIRREYDGYEWAKLPTVDRVQVTVGKQHHESWLCSGKLICVDSITITAHTSNGKVHRSGVCMAANRDG